MREREREREREQEGEVKNHAQFHSSMQYLALCRSSYKRQAWVHEFTLESASCTMLNNFKNLLSSVLDMHILMTAEKCTKERKKNDKKFTRTVYTKSAASWWTCFILCRAISLSFSLFLNIYVETPVDTGHTVFYELLVDKEITTKKY